MLKENSSITEALQALYRANNAGIWLWTSNGALKFKAPEHTDATGILDLLKVHKAGILDILQENGIVDDKPIPFCIYRVPEAAMPLSFAQQRLWFVQQLDAGTSAYHIPAVYELPGDTDLKGIRYALEQIVERHEILRSTINQQGDQETAMQTAGRGGLPIEELSSDTENYVSLIRQEISRPFDLKKDYPLRITLLHIRNASGTGEDKTLLLINSHHIANDGWSSELLEAELKAYYEAYSKGDLSFRLPELRIQYKDYAFWQRCYLSQEILERQLDYWKSKLSGFQTLSLPTDYLRPAHTDYTGSDTGFKLNSKLSEKLRAMARKLGVTMHSIMLSGFHILLSKYTRQDDIVTGSPNANRHHPQTGNLIGFFINAQINRTILNKQQSFEELILQVHRDQTDSQLYQDLPFEKLVNELNIDRSSSRHPVFQIIFEVQGSSEEEQQAASHHGLLTRHELRNYYNIERFDLSVFVNDSAEEIQTTITYATSLFRQETIEYLGLHYSALLESLVQASEQPYSLISPFDAASGMLDAEKELLLHGFNDITPNYDGTYRSVLSLFRTQAEHYPDKAALRFRESEMSYRQLDEWSDMLASHLASKLPASGEKRVGILLDRSDNLIVSLLAVLKAGAAYVPVDPAYPDQRKSHIINDAGITLLITQSDYLFSLDYYTGEVFAVDIELEFLEKIAVAQADPEGHQLAYIIYTSGSTGQPKGCGIRHSNLSHYIQWANQYYFSSEAHGNFGLYTSLSFDLTVTSIFCCLSRGKTLTVYPQDMDLPQILEHSFSKASGIDSIKITPSHIKLLEPMHLHASGIRAAIVGGEAIGRDHIRILKGIDAGIRIYNEYGPTETTVGCVVQELEPDAPVVIGKPIYGAKLYILNEASELLPIGMTGEICIAGMGVGAGYLNKPQLNEGKFTENPFERGQSLYRTGDLGRWLPDGTIDYRGRFDEQVKVRGYRIELGEIEHSLMQTNLFRSVCVIVKDRQVNHEQQRYIVAYYVPKDPASDPDHALVKEELMKFLPDYMVPGLFIGLEEFPLTINGKIDKAVLPDPVFDRHAAHVAPDSETEKEFCRLWMEVLGLQQVGVTDDFFNIGGDSILSIRLVSRLKQAGYQLSVRDIFNFRTIRDVIPHAGHVQQDAGTGYEPFSCLSKEEIGEILGSKHADRDALQDIYPAGYLQAGMLIESAAGQHAYLNVDSFIIGRSFDRDRFETIWQKLVDKHEQLRTAFRKHHTGYLNIVYKSITLPEKITIVAEPAEDLEKLVDLEKHVGFDLSHPGLFRLLVVPGTSSFTLLFSHHHALADGWSVAFLMADFANAYMNNEAIATEVLPSFGKFIQAELQASKAETHKAFWTEYLKDHELNAAPFSPSVKPATAGHNYVQRHLIPELNSAVLDLARKLKVPVDVIFMGIYNLALGKFYDSRDLVIGTASNNRLEEEGGDRVFGLHLNTIPVRFITTPGRSLQDYLLYVSEQKSRIEEHKLYPYAQIKSDLRKEESLYHCSLNYVHFHVEEKNYKSRISKQVYSAGTTSIPLILDVTRYESTFTLALRGAADFIDKATAGKMLDLMVDLLEEASRHPSKALKDFRYLPEKHYQQIVYDWNQTDKPFPEHHSIISLFEEQVSLMPDQIAVVADDIELSYKQLQQQADKFAQHLIHDLGVRPGDKIGIMLNRSDKMIIALLAVLKAGAAYVPIDPAYPSARKQFIAEDTALQLLITQSDYIFDIGFFTGTVFAIDLQLDSIEDPEKSIEPACQNKNLAYIIYTSGTSGKPKGVMIEHAQVVNYIFNLREIIPTQLQCVDLSTNLAFDLTVTTSIAALALGKTIAVYSGELSDVQAYVKHLKERNIDFVKATPSLLANLPADLFDAYRIPMVFVGGEKLDPAKREHILRYTDRLMDEYGPTEATVGTTIIDKSLSQYDGCIGKPYANYKLYILDSQLNPVPVGLTGELYIGGAGLAREYLNQPGLTAKRFIPNPFASESDIAKGYYRLYKTGDTARWLPDGNIEYIGRNDEQVKIRGYRIELSEIERTIAAIDGIKQAAVVVKERNEMKYLAAYYISGNSEISETSLREELSRTLPEYMIPSHFVEMEQLPLTINGKLDKKALPDLWMNQPDAGYTLPQTPLQQTICGIWQQILGIEKIGIHDSFFRIGGDSILSIQVAGRMRIEGLPCQVKDIFEFKTIARLAEHLSLNKAGQQINAEQGILSGELPLLPIQQWFFEQVDAGLIPVFHHWNQSFLIKVPSLDRNRLEQTIRTLTGHHDAFRIRYAKEKDGSWKQYYLPETDIPKLGDCDVSRLGKEELQDLLTGWQSGFDLNTGPLFRIGYLHGYEDGSARIFIALHHLLTDGVSWRILAQDLKTLYEGSPLAPKGSSYRQWAHTIKAYPGQHPEEATYWSKVLKQQPALDKNFVHQPECSENFALDPATTAFLLQEATGLYHTEVNDLLLCALAYALRELNGEEIQFITLEGHGREDIDPAIDHSHTLGWFTSMFPVRLEVKETIRESVIAIKEALRSIPNKGLGFGALAAAKTDGLTFAGLAPVSFNYLGQFEDSRRDWTVSPEESGFGIHPENKEWLRININGLVSEGKLWFNVISTLGEGSTKQLSLAFEQALNVLVEHCRKGITEKESWHSPADFFPLKLSQELITEIDTEALRSENPIEHIFQANSLQQGFVYHALTQNDDDAYRVQILYDYRHALDVGLYIKAWELCIEEYPALRMAFNWQEEIIQIIYKKGALNYQLHDISHIASQQDRDKAIEEIRQQDRKVPFDLQKPALLRIHLIRQADDLYTLLKSEHHSIADGWSSQVLLSAVHGYYQRLKNRLSTAVAKEAAYVKAQEYISAHKAKAQDYWERLLAGDYPANDINAMLSTALDLSKKSLIQEPGDSTLEISGSLYDQLKDLSKREGITMNVIVQFIWHKLLHCYSGCDTTIVGTTVSGRSLPVEGIGESVGLFINTLPLIVDWNNEGSILEQLQQIQHKITEMNTHCFADLAKLQKQGERLFHSLLVYENYPDAPREENVLNFSVRNAVEKTDYPFFIMALAQNGLLTFRLNYDRRSLTEDKVQQLFNSLRQLLHQVAEDPQQAHRQLSILEPDEHRKIVEQWNDTGRDYPQHQTMHNLFEEQTQRSPDATALVFEGRSLSYKTLNEKSNQLARQIRKNHFLQTRQELQPDTPIALCLERSPEMIVAILAVLKAGAAYVPIDPAYPKDRIAFILSDTQASMVLSQKTVQEKHPGKLPQELILGVDLELDLYTTTDASGLPAYSEAKDLAYIIYTSGTTGNPKGVMMEHRPFVQFIHNFNELLHDKVGQDDKHILSLTNYVFDIFGLEYALPLMTGGKILLSSPDTVTEAEITESRIVQQTPGTLLYLTDRYAGKLSHLLCLVGGEALLPAIAEKLTREFQSVINVYGPAETAIWSTSHEVSDFKRPYIGKPLYNEKVYVLDKALMPVPVGTAGELYIGGTGLARGYLNQPELSRERFIANPFVSTEDKAKGYDRIYKTGDSVRWLADGTIQYIGRNDDQVKIRGFRIEPGEIEQVLSRVDGIRQACVLVKDQAIEAGSNKYLVAYYTSGNTELTESMLREQLSRSLPDYMVPTCYIALERFPLTINGKLDKKALPDPELTSGESYLAPENETEKAMCDIWAAVLGLKQVGTTDDFFKIGGNSITALQAVYRINKTMSYNMMPVDIFRHKTIRALLDHAAISSTNDQNMEWELSI